jgi:hypothetical protein
MGYNTKYSLSFDTKSEAGTKAVGLLEFSEVQSKPYSALRKKVPNVESYFEEMEALQEKLGKLCRPGRLDARDYSDPKGILEIVADAWLNNLDECKWYEHEQDMRIFSKLFPEVVFTLKGEGEEPGDLWFKYFQNGKMQKAEAIITYDPFDPKKLK